MLFKNITLIDENFEVKNNMYVGTENDRITYVNSKAPEDEKKYGEGYDGRGKVLMPGFVNSHAHNAMSLLRGYGENLALEAWLTTKIFPFEDHLSGESVYWATNMAMAESLRYGITSSTDMYYFCPDIARAVIDAGAKENISRSVSHFDDGDLIGTYRYVESEEFFRDFHGAADGRILVDMSLHAEYTNTDKSTYQLAELTKKLGTNMNVHVSETRLEHEQCKERHDGLTPVQYLNKMGIFDTPSTAAHCVYIEGEDYDILKEKGVTVAVNPISNMKLASGFCNVPALMEKGINIGIGTDSVASNNSLNFIEEMKMFALASKGAFGDPAVISPADTLRAATVNGARAQGRLDTGLIKEGFKADICVMDVDKPYLYPVHNMLNNIVYSASGSEVVLTMCDGRVLYKDGEYMTIDVEKTIFNVNRCTEEILQKL